MASKVNSKKISNENEMKKFIQMILIVTVIFVAFYGLTILLNKEDKKVLEESPKNEVSIQYDEILIGNIFEQKNDNYYVLIEDIEDVNVPTYYAHLTNYKQKKDAKRIYMAVLNNMFNIKYFKEQSNINDDISKFSVSKTTLIEISKGKIVNYYEKHEDIMKILEQISKTEEK